MFSIIICTYNGGSRLSKVLDSILEQNDFDEYVDKLIIVDNCSTDDTKNIVESYQASNNKIFYLYEKKPGLSNARLCGVNYCSSEWIIFLDDDNFIKQNWIRGAFQYIKSKNNLGAFNGHVIPRFNNDLTKEQSILIKVSYLGLACSTYSEDSMSKIEESKWAPFGAGLVIRTQPLKELASVGWLKSEGRKLDQIISGEDSEMTAWIKKKGLAWGFCNYIFLYHEIGEHRLNIIYLEKLYYSFGVANYIAISKKKHFILRRIKWGIIEGLRYLRGKLINVILKRKNGLYFRNRLYISRAKGYFCCLINERLTNEEGL